MNVPYLKGESINLNWKGDTKAFETTINIVFVLVFPQGRVAFTMLFVMTQILVEMTAKMFLLIDLKYATCTVTKYAIYSIFFSRFEFIYLCISPIVHYFLA